MRVHQEFSRFASQYGIYNSIQMQVAQKLIAHTTTRPARILDIGCGNGTLYSCIDWEIEHFTGVDFSSPMLSCHPKEPNVELRLGDFNDPALFKTLENQKFDHIYSASALQWADDLGAVLEALVRFNTPLSLAIFTSGTFKTLHALANVTPLIRTHEEIVALVQKHKGLQCQSVRYALEFESVREMFRYIKRSGVSGSRRTLNVTQMKQLMKEYPLNYLEFEVDYIFKT